MKVQMTFGWSTPPQPKLVGSKFKVQISICTFGDLSWPPDLCAAPPRVRFVGLM